MKRKTVMLVFRIFAGFMVFATVLFLFGPFTSF